MDIGVLVGDNSNSLCLSMIASFDSFIITLTIFETMNSIYFYIIGWIIRFGFAFIR